MECPSKSGAGPELFIAYAAQTLPAQIRFSLERHLATCDECRHIAEAQQRVWSVLDYWSPQLVSPDFDSKLYARIAAEEQHPWYRRVLQSDRFYRPALPVAALAVLLAGYLLHNGGSPAPPIGSIEKRIDMEQVERALDDIEMLNQMGVSIPAAAAGSPTEPI